MVGEFTTCKEKNTCSITAADISKDGKKIVLLSYGFLWVITDFNFDDFSKSKLNKVDLELRTQLEAVCFKNDSTLLISDEKSHLQGGNLYEYNLN